MLDDGVTSGLVRLQRARRRAYEIVEVGRGDDRASRIFDGIIIVLIVLNIAAFVAETVPSLSAAYGSAFFAFEAASVAAFTAATSPRTIAVTKPPPIFS